MKNCHDDYLFKKKKDKKISCKFPMISFCFLSDIFIPVRTGISKFSFSDFGALCFIFGDLFLVVYKGCFGNLSRKFLLGANSGAN